MNSLNDVNWWLMALSFILGLLLTFAFLIKRVTREVPIYAPLGRGPKVSASGAGDLAAGAAAEGSAKGGSGAATLAAGAAAAGAVSSASKSVKADIADESPYGAGSVRLAAAGKLGPSGYTIKGNEDSMLYHTTESPFYDVTDAEVWFKEPSHAEAAGFTRWDLVGGSGAGGSEAKTAKFATVDPGPYGIGSAKAGAGGSGPTGWTIKGNEDSMLYHTTDSPSYKQTIAEVWFADEETASKAGFTPWHKGKK